MNISCQIQTSEQSVLQNRVKSERQHKQHTKHTLTKIVINHLYLPLTSEQSLDQLVD